MARYGHARLLSRKAACHDGQAPAPLGYGAAERLAFLRRAHSDPVDLFPNEYRQGHADTRLPAFDNDDLDRSLWTRWGQFRVSENIAFLHVLHSAVPLGKAVMVAARGPADRDLAEGPAWYGSWDGVGPPPTYREEFGEEKPGRMSGRRRGRSPAWC